ncbi:MAG: alkaline phosphatase D family protein [Ilumatobacter sp.]|uniref:alkaline phosphatase D family protein n=1 Tax=Ilumatobacter sp. TaxID=1967498 RepID=UPI00260848BE|nr:alkaline phosphatase D family protein [Ilumatobacter sp.]MDJ0770570.1 alkaline phosphatase D family protein [Ilumatobacter sp.]
MNSVAADHRRRGVIVLPPRVELVLRIGARVLLAVAIVVFVAYMINGNLPEEPEGGTFTEDILVPLQSFLLVVAAIGLLLSFRWMAVAAVVVALSGSGVAIISALQYDAPAPLLIAIAFLLPAVMMWLDWQCRETLGKIAVLAVGTSALFAISWIGSTSLYDRYLGPTHPESVAPRLDDSLVRWSWAGAVRSDRFTVTAALRTATDDLTLEVTGPGGEVAGRFGPMVVDEDVPVSVDVDGLEPATDYRYVFESGGVPDELRAGTVTTFPDGPASLTLAFGACARTDANGAVFDAIRAVDPDLYVMLGDLHYRNIGENDSGRFAAAFHEVHASPGQSLLYRDVPVAYVWDDHDYGANDADATSPSRPAARQAYGEFVPHYELPAGDGGAIHQAFTIGRVRVVMLDGRTHRSIPGGVLLGDDQLEWLLDELLAARDTHALTIIASPPAWIGEAALGADHWGGYAGERDRIGAFLDEHDIGNVVLVGADAHMVAIDDGTNSGYGGHDGFPVLQAASLDRPGSVKGGPYSHGTFPGGGQFGVVEVTDTGGDRIDVELQGLTWEGEVLTSLTTSFDVGPAVP